MFAFKMTGWYNPTKLR